MTMPSVRELDIAKFTKKMNEKKAMKTPNQSKKTEASLS